MLVCEACPTAPSYVLRYISVLASYEANYKILCLISEPTGESHDAIRHAVKDAKKALHHSGYGHGAVAFQFVQVSISLPPIPASLAMPKLLPVLLVR